MKRTALFYLIVLVLAAVGIFALIRTGSTLPHPAPIAIDAARVPTVTVAAASASDSTVVDSMLKGLRQNFDEPVSRLFLQLLVIIVACRAMGALFVRLGQPSVVGEMAAGILLGPSLFGLLAPDTFHFVFAPNSLGTIKLLSQIGVCLFMFTVGMDLNVSHVRSKAHAA